LTIRSVAHLSRTQRDSDSDAPYVNPLATVAKLREDNLTLTKHLREAHGCCDEHRDVASATLIETWIDETEKRAWFLYDIARRGDRMGH
jgi:starvation-inducible DNA-binding protein